MKGRKKVRTREESYEWFSHLAEIAGCAIVLGIGVELTWLFFEDRSPWEKAVSAIADVLIGGGVAFELYFARLARAAGDSVQAEANARTAEAEAQSAAAQLETEKLRAALAGRRLTKEQFEVISSKLAGRVIPLVLQFTSGDSEARILAGDIQKSLTAAGIESKMGATMSPEMFGLRIHPCADPAVDIHVELIVSVFRDAGLAIEVSTPRPTPEPVLTLYVGSKPPPF